MDICCWFLVDIRESGILVILRYSANTLMVARYIGFSFIFLFFIVCCGFAEAGADAWLRYASLDPDVAARYAQLPATVVILHDSQVMNSAQTELLRGIRGMLGRTLRVESSVPKEAAFVLGTTKEIRKLDGNFIPSADLAGDAYALLPVRLLGQSALVITGATDRGVLYGTFAFLRKIAQGESLASLHEVQRPSAHLRWINQWDNLDGSIERGYGGASIFFS
jgi:alpha-glucuronidase